MTEDETFNKLKRIPYKDIERIIFNTYSFRDSVANIHDYLYTNDPEVKLEREALLEKYGWTYSDFIKECKHSFKECPYTF